MSRNISFSIDVSDLASLSGDIKDHLDNELGVTLIRTREEIAKNNPVLTGLSKANWRAAESSNVPNSTMPLRSQASNRREAAAIPYDITKSYTIFNNIDYIYYVNYGTSTRRPRFFVQNAISSALRKLNRRR